MRETPQLPLSKASSSISRRQAALTLPSPKLASLAAHTFYGVKPIRTSPAGRPRLVSKGSLSISP